MNRRFMCAALAAGVLGGCGSSDEENGAQSDPSTSSSSGMIASSSSSSGESSSSSSSSSGSSTSSSSTSSSSSGSNPPGPSGPGAAPTAKFSDAIPANGFFRVAHGSNTYWVRLPTGYNLNAPTAAPMIVVLHGCGDNAQNFVSWGAVPYDLRANQSYIGVSMELGRDGQCWDIGADGPKVMAAIADVRKYFFADQRKITIGGFSSGGILAYKLGLANSTMFSSIMIEHSAPDNQMASMAGIARKIPITHNAAVNDGDFPIGTVRTDINLFKSSGFTVVYTEDQGTHDGTSAHFLAMIPTALSRSL